MVAFLLVLLDPWPVHALKELRVVSTRHFFVNFEVAVVLCAEVGAVGEEEVEGVEVVQE